MADGTPLIFDISQAKTGTTSLAQALRVLGFRTCHGCPPGYEKDLVAKLLMGDTRFELFNDYDAVVQLLNFAYWQLDRDHPTARFIYLDRDMESWLDSTLHQLTVKWNLAGQQTVALNAGTLARLLNIGCVHTKDREYLAYRFQLRCQAVMEFFTGNRREKLLIMRVEEGWEPLCQFLGLPVPDAPFPWLNASNHTQE